MANQEADRARRAGRPRPDRVSFRPEPPEIHFAGAIGDGPFTLLERDGTLTPSGLFVITFHQALLNLGVLRPTTGVSASVQTADALSHPPQTPSIHVTEL